MIEQLIGRRISLPEQFIGAVTVESTNVIDQTVLLQVRTASGELREALLSSAEVEEILARQQRVENWLKVKVQLPLINQARSQRQRELQIRQDYLKQAMELKPVVEENLFTQRK